MIIHLLSPHDAQKIAAGEVIERPSNIVKELVENSIDAGASRIEITAKQGGKTHLSVTDNGSGMARDDAYECIKRHTTSKLRTFEELTTINSFGFRGEALASICSVAHVTLITRQKDASEGLCLSIKQGTIVQEKQVRASLGTTFCVDDLFYTVPVRKKFLKTVATEWNQIFSLFKAFCFSYPSIHFTITHDDVQIANCPAVTSLKERCDQLFEKKISSNIIEWQNFSEKNSTVSGCITNQQYSRYDRSGFYFFVNNRLVKNHQLAQAVLRGYENTLLTKQFPIALISITLDPAEVDINIHPKKEDVLFLHPLAVTQAVTHAVKQALTTHATKTVQATVASTFSPSLKPASFFDDAPSYQQHVPPQKPVPLFTPQPHTPVASEHALQEALVLPNDQQTYTIIGQCLDTYVLLEHTDGLLLLDQHAAHERILYEQIRSHFTKTETVPLLFPPIITFSKDDVETLVHYADLLQNHGIVIEVFGQEQIRVTAVPVYAKQVTIAELLQDLLCWIAEEQQAPSETIFKKITEKLHAQLACKAAVKAGDSLSMEKMQELVRTLHAVNNSHSCPHGRPTQWLLSTHEIEKKFKRII